MTKNEKVCAVIIALLLIPAMWGISDIVSDTAVCKDVEAGVYQKVD